MEIAANFAQIVYGAAAAFCLLYYVPCALCWGWYARELAAVLAVGVGSGVLLLVSAAGGINFLWWAIFAIFLLGLCVFLFVEGKVLYAMGAARTQRGAQWLLIPGYKPRKGRAPLVLRQRAAAGAQWLRDNPRGKAILSGAVTDGTVSEAALLQQLLTEQGIEPRRLIREEKATTTAENMHYCLELAGGEAVALVTSGFHLYRACGEARKAGFPRVEPISAGNGPWLLLPYHMTREFMTIVSDKIHGFL